MSDTNQHIGPRGDGLGRRRAPDMPLGQTILVTDDETARRFHELAIEQPAVAVLPRNFATAASTEAFVFEQSTSAIVTLGRRAGLTIQIPGPSNFRSIHEKDAEIIAPVLQVSHAFLVDGGAAIMVAFLEHLVRYMRKRWGVGARDRHVEFEFVVTKGRSTKRVVYRGPQDGLSEIVTVAKKGF